MNLGVVAGGACLVLAGDAVVFRHVAGAPRPGVREWFDGSRITARTRARLAAACIEYTPSQWLLARLLLTVPAAVLLTPLTGSPLAALLTASTLVRACTALFLRLCRGRREEQLERLAPRLARTLAAELRSGSAAGYALQRAAASGGEQDALVRAVLRDAAHAQRLGSTPREALQLALRQAGALDSPSLRLVAHTFAVQAVVGGDGSPLLRVAAALEARLRLQQEARASSADVRFAAAAVPVLTAFVLAVMLSTDPPARQIALSSVGMPVLLMCTGLAFAGVWLVQRVTR